MLDEIYEKNVKPYEYARDEINSINLFGIKLPGIKKPFKLYEYQENFILQKYLHKNVVVVKCRRSGYTTVYVLHMLYKLYGSFNMDEPENIGNFLYVSENEGMNKSVNELISYIISNTELFSDLDGFRKYVKRHIIFTTPNRMLTSMCSHAFQEAFFDEFAFYMGDFSTLVEMTAPSIIPNGTSTFVTSLPDKDKCHDIDTIRRLFKQGYDVSIISTKWFEVPAFNKNLMWKKIILEPTIDDEGNVKYDKEAWEKKIADGWIPTSPAVEKIETMFDDKSLKSELLN